MSEIIQLIAIFAVTWVAKLAITSWLRVRMGEIKVADRRLDLDFAQFEVVKEHHKAARGYRPAFPVSNLLNPRRDPEELS